MDGRVARLSPGVTRPMDADPALGLTATELAGQVDHWGFVAQPDLPDRPGPAFLLVALRPAPTLQHYRSEEHTSELQSQSHISYAVFCLDRKSVV